MNGEQKIASTLVDMVTESKTIHPTNSQRLPPSYIRFPHSASPQNPSHYPNMEEPKSNSSSPKVKFPLLFLIFLHFHFQVLSKIERVLGWFGMGFMRVCLQIQRTHDKATAHKASCGLENLAS